MPLRYLAALILASVLVLSLGYNYGILVGIVVGMPLLLIAAGLYFWFSRTGTDAAWVYRVDDGRTRHWYSRASS
jgi:hypothetical protein